MMLMNSYKYRFIFIACLLLSRTTLFSQINYPSKIRLNTGWEFLKGDLGDIWEGVRPVKPDSPEAVPIWEPVSLPHCFNAEDAVNPDMNYYEGPGWYRTYSDIRNPYENGRTILEFEGAGQKTTVYIYTNEVAKHTGGYDEWTCDITDAVKGFLASENAGRFAERIIIGHTEVQSINNKVVSNDPTSYGYYNYRVLNVNVPTNTAYTNGYGRGALI
jgi:beta-galactosidase